MREDYQDRMTRFSKNDLQYLETSDTWKDWSETIRTPLNYENNKLHATSDFYYNNSTETIPYTYADLNQI